jgi:hypothetical protein
MRRKILIPSLLLSLLCACVDDNRYLLTTTQHDNLVPAIEMPRRDDVHYTRHAATTTRAEIVSLRINGPFVLGDRAKVFRAVNEWNQALNGFVRFEIVPEGGPPPAGKTWTIVASHDNPPAARSALAFTYALPNGGGLMAVYLDRVGTRDLGGVVMHELGHVLGLGHDSGGLMATHYHPTAQQCVDKAAVEAVAARRGLPLGQLNWCEPAVATAVR